MQAMVQNWMEGNYPAIALQGHFTFEKKIHLPYYLLPFS